MPQFVKEDLLKEEQEPRTLYLATGNGVLTPDRGLIMGAGAAKALRDHVDSIVDGSFEKLMGNMK